MRDKLYHLRHNFITGYALFKRTRSLQQYAEIPNQKHAGFLIGYFPWIYGKTLYASNPPDRTAR